ncbi:L,D-transpeptidase [Aestuariivirga sp.]|uniref:L,D-transpeptidase n=1 Tax=Aestuariivirga sp. TaxID=2650926 RepID=UPI003593486C
MNRRDFYKLAGGSLVSLGIGAGSAPAQLVSKHADQLENGEFNWFPERSASGPMLIIVSIPDQKVHVYRNGVRIAASTCSTGKPGHSTPTGVFKILQKDKHHHSSTYNNAPMPNMNRLTWSGIALHAGQLPGYPASHGCVRLPLQFSEMLFGITRKGMTVVIADNKSFPSGVVHPGMVLGQYARSEFDAVDMALKKSQYSEGRSSGHKATSVVVSAKDKRITVFEDDRIVASGGVKIVDDHKPLANRAYMLHGADSGTKDLRWTSIGYGKSDREDMSAQLSRIEAEPRVREEVRKRLHHGMTMVTTNESSTDVHRSGGDFVIIDGIY